MIRLSRPFVSMILCWAAWFAVAGAEYADRAVSGRALTPNTCVVITFGQAVGSGHCGVLSRSSPHREHGYRRTTWHDTRSGSGRHDGAEEDHQRNPTRLTQAFNVETARNKLD